MQLGLLVTFAATSRRHSTKLAGRKWTAATRVQKPKPRTAGVSASEHNRARATVEPRWGRRTLGFDRVKRLLRMF
jgi:hypothetical protein